MQNQSLMINNKLGQELQKVPGPFSLDCNYKNSSEWLEISAQAFDANIACYKRAIHDKKIALVVKANAYGHGLENIGKLAQLNNDISWLCVATTAEALELRNYGITKPLLVLNPNPFDMYLDKLAENNIDIIVDDISFLDQLNALGTLAHTAINIHVKVNSGLARFGLSPTDIIDFINYARTRTSITVRGLCSHFAQSDNSDTQFTQQQEHIFFTVVAELATRNLLPPIIHIDNSAGSTTAAHNNNYIHTNTSTCLVRIGAGAYGVWPSLYTQETTIKKFPWFTLTPILTWKSRIMAIKVLPEQTPIGYNKTFITEKITRIGLLPIGYYNGYDRRLSNKGMVKIGAYYAPVVGLVAMNTITIDITLIPDAIIGTEVILMGPYDMIDPRSLVTTTQQHNPREFLTRINPLVKRITCI